MRVSIELVRVLNHSGINAYCELRVKIGRRPYLANGMVGAQEWERDGIEKSGAGVLDAMVTGWIADPGDLHTIPQKRVSDVLSALANSANRIWREIESVAPNSSRENV